MRTYNLIVALAVAVAGIQGSAEQPGPRFDTAVRADFFAGFGGDRARFERAMEVCERVLAETPAHAEALVWHGSGLIFQAGQAFAGGDTARGTQLWQRGLEEMGEAVRLEPENAAVLIPRGAVLLQATRTSPPEIGRPLLELAVADYEKVLAIQAPYFHTLGDHPKGELLFGLADGSARLGRMDKAREYFNRLLEQAPASGQAPRARVFIETGVAPPVRGLGCVGCHK
jgi:tetratricopeptide (TPR) repeat protein